MSRIDLHKTYEKMYAHEEEIKNNISVKAQVLFTAIFILASTTVYLARFLDFSEKPEVAYIIATLIGSVILIAAVSVYCNCRAFSGSEFSRMPYATKVNEYYDDLVKYNIEVEKYNAQVEPDAAIPLVDPIAATEDLITKNYIDNATNNAVINENRSRWWFKAFLGFLFACIPLGFASLLFVVFDMDTSSPRKNLAIKDLYVGDKIDSLRRDLAHLSQSGAMADLEKRTKIIEQTLLALKESTMTDAKKNTTSETQPKPSAPVKPSAPPSRVAYDDVNGGPNRSAK